MQNICKKEARRSLVGNVTELDAVGRPSLPLVTVCAYMFCKKYARNMQEKIQENVQKMCTICKKKMQNMRKNMQEICKKKARNMHNMQNMQDIGNKYARDMQ